MEKNIHGSIIHNMTEDEIATQAVDAAYNIHVRLGPGLLESAYEKLMAYELGKRSLNVACQVSIPIVYENIVLETGYRADMVIANKVILELKAIEQTTRVHKKQLLTYLRLSDKHLGLLINFGGMLIKSGISRVVNNLEEPSHKLRRKESQQQESHYSFINCSREEFEPEDTFARKIVHAAYKIHTLLGPGLLSSTYETVLVYELKKQGLKVTSRQTVPLVYENINLDIAYQSEIVVEDLVAVMLKSTERMLPVYKKELLTHLKVSHKRLGLLLNFGKPLLKDGIARIART